MTFEKGDIVEIVANHPAEVRGSMGIIVSRHKHYDEEAYDINYCWGLGGLADATHSLWTYGAELRKVGHIDG